MHNECARKIYHKLVFFSLLIYLDLNCCVSAPGYDAIMVIPYRTHSLASRRDIKLVDIVT